MKKPTAFQVPPKVRTERISTCTACPYFVASTGTCGPLIIGRKLTTEEMEREGLIVPRDKSKRGRKSKVRLCGCRIGAKTRLHFARCPLDKWGTYGMDKAQRESAKKFLSSLRNTGISSPQRDQVYRYVMKLLGRRIEPSSCPPCVKEWIEQLKAYLEME